MCSGGRAAGSNHCKTTAFVLAENGRYNGGEGEEWKGGNDGGENEKGRQGERKDRHKRGECCFWSDWKRKRERAERRLAPRERRKQDIKSPDRPVAENHFPRRIMVMEERENHKEEEWPGENMSKNEGISRGEEREAKSSNWREIDEESGKRVG